ncbi:uncharacterized protein LOC110460229 [Mizuhopecten yessoensis]|uniref:Protein trunk n=1 Tax=Mizuhopecten yessoensis TaxID=6573 RepID=A0A210Q2Y4_MIZYE|nr:uncharacterized protein LOC110460229 [Mizuhopecten yessoensis]OWF43097.1 Protein trunk [Mizuhopecten yessoensis]
MLLQPPGQYLCFVSLMVTCLSVYINAQNRVPIDLLPHCDGQHDALEDLFTIVPGLSALKRASTSHPYEGRLLRRFSGPFSDNIPLPWTCSMTPIWRDLGEDYYPRFVRDGTCNNRTCWYRHYECQPVLYTLSVLERQNSECFDQSLPRTLSTAWRQRAVTITSSCMCHRV